MTLNSLNLDRLDYIFQDYMKKRKENMEIDVNILTPVEMRTREVHLGVYLILS